MAKSSQSIKPYQDPFIYSIVIAVIGLLLVIYGAYTNSSLTFWASIILTIGVVSSILIYDTRCPCCKRPFSKQEQIELKEKLREETRPYTYYDKIKYLYSDGTTKNIVDDKQHTITEHWETDRHHYKCKNCGYTWTKVEEVNLDEDKRPKPYVKIINTKEKNPTDINYEKKQTKERVPIPFKIKKEVMERAGHKCQVCGHSISLKIHHIDHNPSNNSKHNLIVLCPTHHDEADKNVIRKDQLYSLRDKQASPGRISYK